MRWLILGASSFYGSNFCEFLARRGESVIGLAKPDWFLGEPIPDGFDYIVNFASKSLVAPSWDAPQDWANTNVSLTARLFDQLRAQKFRKYIHVSTPEVYGSNDEWVKESQRFNPTTPYAVTRAAGDMMLASYGKAYGLPYVITRTSNIYGAGQALNRIIPATIHAIKTGRKLNLEGGGKSKRGFIHISDACEATYRCAIDGAVGSTYHIATVEQISILGLVAAICKIAGAQFGDVVRCVDDRLGKDFAYLLDSNKLQRMGWSPTIKLYDGLVQLVTEELQCESSQSA